MNHTLYIVLNFEVLKPYSEKKTFGRRGCFFFFSLSDRILAAELF